MSTTSSFTDAQWLLLLMSLCCLSRSSAELRDYCLTETFSAGCPEGQVILIDSAHYGRMRIGRCVKLHIGYLDCFSDALPVLDRRCSGRRSCSMTVPDPALEELKPCNEEVKSYLAVDYHCVPEVQHTQCNIITDKQTTSQDGSFISSAMTTATGCGNDIMPWTIRVLAGQRINLTLFDFNLPVETTASAVIQTSPVCYQYGEVREPLTLGKRSAMLCGRTRRQQVVYSSTTNVIDVTISDRLASQRDADEPVVFMLKYEVVGCPDDQLPSGRYVYVEKLGDVAVVGCSPGDRRWQLVCHNSSWIGQTGNCTAAPSVTGNQNQYSIGSPLPAEVAVAVVAGVSVAVGVAIIGIGLFVVKRRFRHLASPRHQQRHTDDGDDTRHYYVDKPDLTGSRGCTCTRQLQYGMDGRGCHHPYDYVYRRTSPDPALGGIDRHGLDLDLLGQQGSMGEPVLQQVCRSPYDGGTPKMFERNTRSGTWRAYDCPPSSMASPPLTVSFDDPLVKHTNEQKFVGPPVHGRGGTVQRMQSFTSMDRRPERTVQYRHDQTADRKASYQVSLA